MLAVVVPRFSRAAIVSVAVLLFTGIVASIVHLPTLASLWETNYGLALIAKSVLLACALALGAVNNLRSRPRLVAAARAPRPGARRRRGAIAAAARAGRESSLLVGAVVAAAILTSLAPPSSALAKLGKADGARRARRRRAHLHAQRGAHPGRHPAQPRRDRQRLRAAPRRNGKPVRNASSPRSSTCST